MFLTILDSNMTPLDQVSNESSKQVICPPSLHATHKHSHTYNMLKHGQENCKKVSFKKNNCRRHIIVIDS